MVKVLDDPLLASTELWAPCGLSGNGLVLKVLVWEQLDKVVGSSIFFYKLLQKNSCNLIMACFSVCICSGR